MAEKPKIVTFGTSQDDAAGEEILLTDEIGQEESLEYQWIEAEEPERRIGADRLAPALALAAIALWTAFFAWARDASGWGGLNPGQWTGLVGDWSVPVLLIGLGWLLFMRNSRREALRFGEAARVLSDESARLEARLLVINRELSLAREFIASQAKDLDALGRVAVDRLSQNADRLQDLIRDNGSRIDSIGMVSEAALANMEKLRGQLPVLASSAKDVTNNIGNAGRAAHAQLEELISGFKRLNEFGQASERQVMAVRNSADEAIAGMTRQCEQLGELAQSRFAALAEQGEEFRNQLDRHEVEALAAIRTRATALAEELERTRRTLDGHEEESLTSLRARLSSLRDEGAAVSRALREGESRAIEGWRESLTTFEAQTSGAVAALSTAQSEAVDAAGARLAALMDEVEQAEARLKERSDRFARELERRRADNAAVEEQALTALSERLGAIDAEIAERRVRHERDSAAIAAHGEAILAQLEQFERRSAAIASFGDEAQSSLSTALQALADRLQQARAVLSGTDDEIAALTDASVRLLELIRASEQHCREDLPAAMAAGEQRLAAIESGIEAMAAAVADASGRGEDLSRLVADATTTLIARFGEIDALQATLGERSEAHDEALTALCRSLEEIERRSDAFAAKTRAELAEAIEHLSAAAHSATAQIGEKGAAAVTGLARQFREESSAAIDRAMRSTAAETAGQLEAAAAHAAGVSREAAILLRDQLAKVNELVGNLERRVAHARQRAEEQVDNDFARRVALITESLNSNSIDIAKALSSDVSETAWAAYLRGDRGIFTRRAVALLENSEAKAVAQIYERDSEFNEHVSRYIHDFEAMLRQVLSTRDGQALGVTLLSSDMGKLYVALAQSIERLRG